MTAHRMHTALTALLLVACGVLVACVAIAGSGDATSTGAYLVHGFPGSDNAGPPIDALVHARLGRLPRLQTVMGLTSILWRAPFVAVAMVSGAGERVGYAAGAAACLLPLVGVVAWLATRERSWRQLGRAGAAALVMLLGTSTVDGVTTGHPEGALMVALELVAVIAAMQDRRLTAALALGLAIGTKETALLAVPAVLVALPGGRIRALLIAAAVGLAGSAPLVILDPHAFLRADASIGPITLVGSMSAWWPLGGAAHQLPLGLQRPLATVIALAVAAALIALAGAGTGAGARRSRPPSVARTVDPLALLALCGMLRCLADPADLMYYFVGALVPLVAWEVGMRRRAPIVSILFWGVQALCYGAPIGLHEALVQRAPQAGITGFLVAAVVLAGYLAVGALGRPTAGTEPDLPPWTAAPAPVPAPSPGPQSNGLRSMPELKPA